MSRGIYTRMENCYVIFNGDNVIWLGESPKRTRWRNRAVHGPSPRSGTSPGVYAGVA